MPTTLREGLRGRSFNPTLWRDGRSLERFSRGQREDSLMRSLLRSILGFLALGMFAGGCGQSDNPPASEDVVAHVAGLT